MYDLTIIGGGPAGVAAGIYAARKKIKTILLAENFAGQSVVSPEIQNWIGTIKISGAELAKNMENHLRAYANDIVDIQKSRVENIRKNDQTFEIKTANQTYQAKTILIGTGNQRRKLPIADAEKFEGKGVVYCATCDGPLFAGKDVVVVGGGNAAFETASQLLAYVKSVTLLQRSTQFRADEITVKKLSANQNFTALLNTQITKIKGDNFVQAVVCENTETGTKTEIPAEGIFVEIGSVPATAFVKNLVDLDKFGAIVVNAKTQQTSLKGIWAAGDCADGLYHQNNIAVGDGIKALENIYNYLQSK